MNLKHALAAIALVLNLAGPVAAGSFEDAVDAYNTVRLGRPLADVGDAVAQKNLGFMYRDGRGVTKNNVTAYMWFSLSAVRGNRDAVKQRDMLERSMTPAQIAEAQKLAREWKPRL